MQIKFSVDICWPVLIQQSVHVLNPTEAGRTNGTHLDASHVI